MSFNEFVFFVLLLLLFVSRMARRDKSNGTMEEKYPDKNKHILIFSFSKNNSVFFGIIIKFSAAKEVIFVLVISE